MTQTNESDLVEAILNPEFKTIINNNTDLDADLLLLFDKIIENHEDEDENPVVSNLEKEKEIFKTMLNEKTFLTTTSIKFWLENKKTFPNLYKFCLILFNIPASSAYVERFFSICGLVNRKRAGNMTDRNLINRAFLKTNIDVL